MRNATLVIMAAGIGSRYGGGIKQLAKMGPGGEIIMDYSIYDAMAAGFNKVVFVIRRDLEEDFKKVIGNRIEKVVETAYTYQELDDIPEQFRGKGSFGARTKPWGTGQAILCCKGIVDEPFLVINADDYYGKEAYREAYEYLTRDHSHSRKMDVGMVGFVLKNTLSDNGTVTRGICKVNADHMLTDIEETYEIRRQGDIAVAKKDGEIIELDLDSPVSMNMWALQPEFLDILESGFAEFLEKLDPEDVKTEYLLPRIIGELLKEERIQVNVLESHDKWFGVTYKEDKAEVEREMRILIEKGEYPEKIYYSYV